MEWTPTESGRKRGCQRRLGDKRSQLMRWNQ